MNLRYLQFSDRSPAGAAVRAGGQVCVRLLVGALAGLCGLAPAAAQRYEEPHMSLYGFPGLLDTPSARFQSDGTLSVTGSTKQPDDRITIAFQITPWLEGTARYSVVYDFQGPVGPLYDRSLGLKLRLWPEGRFMPQIAAGALDIGGTAIYGGEYLVASKKIGFVDATLGMGFGRLGSSGGLTNPLTYVSDRFKERDEVVTLENTGRFDAGDFFSGEEVSLFGGIQVETPIRGLNLIAEYSGDDYEREAEVGIYEVESPYNFGISYAPNNGVEVGAGWIGGRELSLRITLRANLKEPNATFKLDPAPLAVAQRDEIALREAIAVQLDLDGAADVTDPSREITGDWRPAERGAFAQSPEAGTGVDRGTLERFARGLDPQLARIFYRFETFSVDGTEAVFEIRPTAARPPVECSQIWTSLRAESLPGVERLTFVDVSASASQIRCTRLIAAGTGYRAKTDYPQPQQGPSTDPAAVSRTTATPAAPPDFWWEDQARSAKIEAAIVKALKGQRLAAESIVLSATSVEIHLINKTYVSQGKAIGRAARALTHVLPPSVEQMTFVLTVEGLNGTQVTFPRRTLERVAKTNGAAEEILVSSDFRPARPGLPRDGERPGRRFPYIEPIFGPGFRQSLFDPDDPLRFQIYLKLGADVKLTRNLSVEGVYSLDIWNNFDESTRLSNSTLPKVRSNAAEYLKQGDTGIERLQVSYVRQLLPEVYGRISAGYLEDMFGGVSAEVLYRPFYKRWAVGAELSQVWQRDFDRGLGFQDYDVLTGHISAYWDSPFHDLDFAVHSGRYLAGDDGLTFEVNRRFANGAQVGAFATFTDIGFDRFGEGSFDKGVRIVIPLDFISLFSTQRRTGVTLTPLTRDGGARLYSGPKLYDLTYGVSYGSVQETWDDLLARR